MLLLVDCHLWFHKRMVVALLVYTAKNTVPVVWPAVQCLLGGRHTTCGKVALMGWAFLPTLIILFVLQVSHQNNSWLGEPHSVTRCLDGVPTVIVGNVTFNVLYNTMFSLFYSQAISGLPDGPLLERLLVPAAEKRFGWQVTSNMPHG